MKKRIGYIIITVLCIQMGKASAQHAELMRQFRAANTTTDISYRYKMLLFHKQTGRLLDSTKGYMYVKDGEYVDSSDHAYTARIGNYFCRLDHRNHSATIASITALSRRMHIPVKGNTKRNIFTLTDSLIAQQGSYEIESADPAYYRLKLRLKNYPVSYVQIDFDKQSYKMINACYESVEYDPQNRNNSWLSRMQITGISSTVERKSPTLSGIFTLADNKILLNKKYAKYTLLPIE